MRVAAFQSFTGRMICSAESDPVSFKYSKRPSYEQPEVCLLEKPPDEKKYLEIKQIDKVSVTDAFHV